MADIKRSRRVVRVIGCVAALWLAGAGAPAFAGGGEVLPPQARPRGYSLLDMMSATALFDTSGNDPGYYPDTPFQILYNDPNTLSSVSKNGGLIVTGTRSFAVGRGVPFYMPMIYADDSPPIAGDFPTDPCRAAAYFFGPSEAGARDVRVFVDGKPTAIGPAYLPGLVHSPSPLLDGGGTHIMVLGVFLTPLSKGTHTLSYEATFAGAAVLQTYGLTFLKYVNTYEIVVQ